MSSPMSQPPSQPVNPSVQVNSHNQHGVSAHQITGYFVVAIPVIMLLSIIGYKKYRITVRRRRLAMLERLWLIDVNKRTR